jgi:superfamily I DNA/RNA helicase
MGRPTDAVWCHLAGDGGVRAPLAPASIAVLARSAYQLKAVEEALFRVKVPAAVAGAAPILSRPELALPLALLRLVAQVRGTLAP